MNGRQAGNSNPGSLNGQDFIDGTAGKKYF